MNKRQAQKVGYSLQIVWIRMEQRYRLIARAVDFDDPSAVCFSFRLFIESI